MDGYVQVYTGDGKGEITAALGLSIRAAGAGLKVYIGHFVAPRNQDEFNVLKRFADQISVEWFGVDRSPDGAPAPGDGGAARKGLEKIKTVMAAGEHDVVIMEGGNVAAGLGFFSVQDLLDLIASKPPDVELVVTGPGADPRVMERADLVTEVKRK
ncbi:MAG: cob(I)yrinic acid a,c-diamide adenosyltransferase [Desulfobacterales bacterium]|nr:cob(I)yrinic acid a,c-diamide adenosyltransferase [Desulfobacterales bacterium]